MIKLTDKQKEITKISKRFASGFKSTFPSINGSKWFIVDPLSGYLNASGFENELIEMPANRIHPQVLILRFKDGTQFIPAGGDLKPLSEGFKNWMWI